MWAMKRLNLHGRQYLLNEVFNQPGQTRITYGTKSIVVNHSIHDLNSSWYQWVNGMLIQDAFPFLSPDEREFLITGITADEWNQIFENEEK